MRKKQHFLLLLFLLASFDLLACDGCTVFFSLTPFDQQSSAGLIFRVRHQAGLGYPVSPVTHHRIMHGSVDATTSSQPNPVRVSQSFYSMAANLRMVMPAKFVLQAQLPYRINTYTEPEVSVSESGLGDLSFLVGWQGLEWRKGHNAFRFTPMVGVKLPTGWQYASEKKAMAYLDLQGGTGSVDWILDPSWILRLNGLGVCGGHFISDEWDKLNGHAQCKYAEWECRHVQGLFDQ
jgi:hypothetical protein